MRDHFHANRESYPRNRPCQHILHEYGVYRAYSCWIRVDTGTPILSRPLQYPQE